MEETRTLKQLIEESASQNTESFRELVERLNNKLFSYLRSRTNSREEALDVLQDVFVDMWQAFHSFEYRSDEGFYRFLYTIARRRLSKIRRNTQEVHLDEEVEVADETSVRVMETSTNISLALSHLDTRAHEIVALRHWSGFSFREIGAMLTMSEEAVRVRHHRALQKMRTVLETNT